MSYLGRDKKRTPAGQALLAILLLLLLCILYLVLDLVGGVFGGALPQAKFALVVQAVTAFDLKSRRNLFSHLWHSLVVLYVAALFAWNVYFLGALLLWALCLFAFLMFTRTRDEGAVAEPWRSRVRADLVNAIPWMAAWLLLSGVAFLALPRSAGRPLAVPLLFSIPLDDAKSEPIPALLPLVGSTSNTPEGAINLRVRGSLGEETVMRVRSPASSYWRTYVLESYDSQGQSWKRADRGDYATHLSRTIAPIEGLIQVQDEPSPAGKTGLPQTFYIEKPLTVEIPLSYPVQELYFPARGLQLTTTGTVSSPYALRRGVTYGAVSQLRDTSPAALRKANPIPSPEDRIRTNSDLDVDLTLPGGIPLRVKQLADRLTAGQPTEFDKVAAVVSYLRTNYRYSLDAPRLPAGADAVDRFLFVDRVGFCEQFASALAVMLREEGIPARLAVGYSTGDHDAITGAFTVRARDAHAWVEVLFPGVGWVPEDASPGFDPSPAAQQPLRWFLSDFQISLPLSRIGAVAGTPLGLAAVGAVLLLVVVSLTRRRLRYLPEVRRYRSANRWLGLARLPRRSLSQTPREHLGQLLTISPRSARALEPLARGLEDAVYGDRRAGGPRTTMAVVMAAFRHRFGGWR